MRRLAVLSMHTSPLAQPGTGDGGGMNVYVRELYTALARQGAQCDVFTRSWDPDLPTVVPVEPGLRVHHVAAGPPRPLAKAALGPLVEEFADAVAERIQAGPWHPRAGGQASAGPDAIHAHYWLSGAAGHILKHRLDVPLVTTFHTLELVKRASGASDGADDPRRAEIEKQVIGCSDAVMAPDRPEGDHLVHLYGARPERVRLVAPGVDHAFFGPGDRAQARRALGLPGQGPMLLFMGRIQPLKGASLAVEAVTHLRSRDAFLVVVGGPSGPAGQDELARMKGLVEREGLGDRVRFVAPQPHELVSTYYRAADVCLVPSAAESFGLVALEAAACGVPVVASAVGGLRALVLDGRTGLLVHERRADAYARAVDSVLSDPARASALGRTAASNAARYTWRRAAETVERIHLELDRSQLVECA